MAGTHEAVFEGDVSDRERLEERIGHGFYFQWSDELHSIITYGARFGFAEA
jgi:hypothetical protein